MNLKKHLSIISPPMEREIISSTKVTSTIVDIKSTAAFLQKMWLLYSRYHKVNPTAFFEELEANDFYAIYQCGDQLVGFTGFRYKKIDIPFGRCQTLYIGHTVMDKNYRGSSLFSRTCLSLIFKHYLRYPLRPLYIWCDAITFKSYLLFANVVKKFHPTFQEKTPIKIISLLEHLGQHYYGENYQQGKFIVKKSFRSINDFSPEITPSERINPHVSFFETKNPGHVQGDSLMMITRVSYRNIFSLINKIIQKSISLF